jgi:adenylate cyclase
MKEGKGIDRVEREWPAEGVAAGDLAVTGWLVAQGRRCGSPAALLDGYCRELRDAGVPVERATLGAPLLHPIAQSSYVFWSVDAGATQRWFQWTPEALETMRASPIHPIYSQGKASRLDLTDPEDRARYPIGEDLRKEGFTAYDALALEFPDGSFKALTLATRAEGGFSVDQRSLVERTLPALAIVFEGYIGANTARTLMETYVGKRAGLRVLNGEIARGDGSFIDAVIWLSDMRGFTQLAQQRSEQELLATLNDYFGLVTDAIEEQQGEVLKFIGDAVLAIFAHDEDPALAVGRAETAARLAVERYLQRADPGFDFGIGLHPGRVFYGNVGGGQRLDFTVIGEAVNLASRIEGMTGPLKERILASSDLVRHSQGRWRSLGDQRLKGVDKPVEILAPA